MKGRLSQFSFNNCYLNQRESMIHTYCSPSLSVVPLSLNQCRVMDRFEYSSSGSNLFHDRIMDKYEISMSSITRGRLKKSSPHICNAKLKDKLKGSELLLFPNAEWINHKEKNVLKFYSTYLLSNLCCFIFLVIISQWDNEILQSFRVNWCSICICFLKEDWYCSFIMNKFHTSFFFLILFLEKSRKERKGNYTSQIKQQVFLIFPLGWELKIWVIFPPSYAPLLWWVICNCGLCSKFEIVPYNLFLLGIGNINPIPHFLWILLIFYFILKIFILSILFLVLHRFKVDSHITADTLHFGLISKIILINMMMKSNSLSLVSIDFSIFISEY